MSCNSNTRSTCSSTSNCNDMDSLVCDIISVALQDMCGNCGEGNKATCRCMDCSELLCDLCVRAHKRVRLTKDHRIRKLSNNLLSSPVTVDSELSSPERRTSPYDTKTICDIHHEPIRLLCATCYLPACSDCILGEHALHEVSYIQDDENAFTVHTKLSEETKSAMTAVATAMEKIKFMSTKIHLKLQKTTVDVHTTFKRYMTALERRAEEIVGKLEQIHRFKAARLLNQMERLRLAQARLTYVSNMLSAAYTSSSSNEFIIANEKAYNELKSIRSIKSELDPCEDDDIRFTSVDNGVFSLINSLGNISTCPWGQEAATPALPIQPSENLNIIDMTSICRPIFGVKDDVLVKNLITESPIIFGKDGGEDGELCRPWGVCCNNLGHIIVADRSNNRVQVFDACGNFLYKFGKQGSAMGQFDRPAGICVSPVNHIVVADKDNHRVQIFKMDGTFILAFGQKGCQNGQFNYPWDVACNSRGDIAVSDTRNHRIQLFTCAGAFINKYGFDTAPMWKFFDSPRGVCFTPSGKIMTTDFNNHRIIIIDKDFTHAQFLGEEGSKEKQFLRPQGIICDDQGNIVVADSKNHRIQVFDSCGNFLFSFGKHGKGPGEFDRPSGICLSPTGKIIIVDFSNTRIQIF